MLNGGLAGKLILFSIPLAFSSILQQLFNSADVAVVGRFAGDQALAAVGSCVALVGIFVNLIVGLAVGPNAVLANLIGQKNRNKINSMVHTILTFGVVLGIGLLGIGMLVARLILVASGTPETVLDQALLYIQDLFCGNSVYGRVQLWICHCEKLRGYQKTNVLSDCFRSPECDFKPDACHRVPYGS